MALACLLGGIMVGAPRCAHAQTDEIQVYDAEIAAPGTFNLTWHNNFTPSGREQPDFEGGVVPNHALNGVPEWAYGVTDWFEAGTYLPVYTRTADGALLFDSVKLRALFVVPQAAGRTFFYGLNFELSYNTPHWEPYRYSGEMRPIIGWHLGPFDLIVNPILDTDFNGLGRLDFAPAARAAYRVSTKVAVALEEYADLGPLQHLKSATQQAQTVFAVLDYGSSSNGIEFGVGKGLTRASDSTVVKLMLMHDL
ncbi:MAG TPA: hypothetical protein VNX02_13105 [Steroidobacteraceae bacterium]|nr:hypothetical protein [Steroidobacteraceae bacterium]